MQEKFKAVVIDNQNEKFSREIKEILSNAEQVDKDFVDAYKEVLKEANERFGLANFA